MMNGKTGKNKKDLVNAFMSIPASQNNAFWSLYDQYENERKAYGRQRIALIEQYANEYDSLNDQKAILLMNKKIALYNSFGTLQKKYFERMTKVIGGKQSARFFQLEDYLENSIRLSIQDEIPFIDQLQKTKKS